MSKETTLRENAPGSRREPRASLVFYFRDGAKIVEPSTTPITVGRTWPAEVVVDDPSVSRAHARFFVAPDGGVCFEDLGSTNGTRLNGVVAPRGRIGPGDEVRVGDVSVALHVLSVFPTGHGLLAYDRLLEILADELVRARTFGRPAALVIVAARAPGHPLRTWAPALIDELRPIDRAAVYATDALLVALPECARADADALGTAICGKDASLRFGTAIFPDDGTTADELVDAARSAMMHGPSSRKAVPSIVRGERSRPVWDLVERVASSVLPVLVIGETGTGKEVVAQALHRRAGPIKSINCAAIPQNLLESVLFGHEKGAFTGADRQSKGVFEQADGGTLFLDEVGELPAGAQAALLRVLETKKIVRVGGDKEIAVDVRVVAATHRDLEQMSREGAFRTDLYYRLHGVTIALPPLRERTDEIGALADGFLREACRDNGRSLRGIDPSALEALVRWRWPGNVRELKNVVERAVVIARGDVITLDDLPERLRAPAPTAAAAIPSAPIEVVANTAVGSPNEDYKERLRREMARYETELIVNALTAANGNVTAAAQALRIPVRTLTHKMNALGIKKRFG